MWLIADEEGEGLWFLHSVAFWDKRMHFARHGETGRHSSKVGVGNYRRALLQ